MLTNWGQFFYSFLTGITEILPVSSSAHSQLALKLIGGSALRGLPMMLVHIGILLSLYTKNIPILTKMYRARKLSMIPKKKRKRPLDVHSLLDLHFWYTILIPVVLVLLFYGRVSSITVSMPVMAVLIFINGVILYIPQFFPGSNKDSRMLTRAEGLFMGFCGSLGIIPGLSLMGGTLSAASILGVEQSYSHTMAQLLEMIWMLGMIIYDISDMVTYGLGLLTLQSLLVYALCGIIAFAAVRIALRILNRLSASIGYQGFALYCWGIALFSFILNLLA